MTKPVNKIYRLNPELMNNMPVNIKIKPKAIQLIAMYPMEQSIVIKILKFLVILFMFTFNLPSQCSQLIKCDGRFFLVRRLAVPFELSFEFLHAFSGNSAGNNN